MTKPSKRERVLDLTPAQILAPLLGTSEQIYDHQLAHVKKLSPRKRRRLFKDLQKRRDAKEARVAAALPENTEDSEEYVQECADGLPPDAYEDVLK